MPNEISLNIGYFADSRVLAEALRELRARVEAAGMNWYNGGVTMTSGTDSHRLVYSPPTPRPLRDPTFVYQVRPPYIRPEDCPEEYAALVERARAKQLRFNQGGWVLARLPGEEHYSHCVVVGATDDEKYLVRKDGAEYAVPPEAIVGGRCSVCGTAYQLHGTLAGKTLCLECEKKANA